MEIMPVIMLGSLVDFDNDDKHAVVVVKAEARGGDLVE